MKVRITACPKADNGLKVHWGGDVQQISQNPYDGGTAMGVGNTHDQSDGSGNTGIGISWNGNPVEIQNQEPVTTTSDGALNVFGAMKVPGEKITFEKKGIELAKKENKAMKKLKEADALMLSNDPNNRFGLLSFNAGRVMKPAADGELKAIASEKQNLADLQQAMLTASHNMGITPKEVSNSMNDIPMYEDGGSVGVNAMKNLIMQGRFDAMRPGKPTSQPMMEQYQPQPRVAPAADNVVNNSTNTATTNKIAAKEMEVLETTGGNDFVDYAKRAQHYLNKVAPGTDVTGEMLAAGAKKAYAKYHKLVPVDLALSQLTIEGYLAKGKGKNKPQRTKNPFNVGNVDDGSVVNYNKVQNAVDKYYNLVASDYLATKDADKLFENYTNKHGLRYASDKNYEKKLKQSKQNIFASWKDYKGEYGIKAENGIKKLGHLPYSVESEERTPIMKNGRAIGYTDATGKQTITAPWPTKEEDMAESANFPQAMAYASMPVTQSAMNTLAVPGMPELKTAAEYEAEGKPQPLADIAGPKMTGNKKKNSAMANQAKLKLRDVLPEVMTALQRPDPVDHFRLSPTFEDAASKISLQDQLNRNNDTFRAMSQNMQNNPAALSVLGAQKYMADASTLGNQFALNQEREQGIRERNNQERKAVKQANLSLAMDQSQKKAGAVANTRNARNAALTSIGDKLAASRQEQNTINAIEANRRFAMDNQGNFAMTGNPYQFIQPLVRGAQPMQQVTKNNQGTMGYMRGADGKLYKTGYTPVEEGVAQTTAYWGHMLKGKKC